jgi:hypothetical protein
MFAAMRKSLRQLVEIATNSAVDILVADNSADHIHLQVVQGVQVSQVADHMIEMQLAIENYD